MGYLMNIWYIALNIHIYEYRFVNIYYVTCICYVDLIVYFINTTAKHDYNDCISQVQH